MRTSSPMPAAEDLGDLVVRPVLDVVERPLEQEPLGRVAVVVEDHDDRVEPCRAIVESSMPVIWKAPSPTMTRISRVGVGHAGPDRGRHAEPHRRVVGRAEELGVPVHLQVGRAEERIADVGDHGHVGVLGEHPVEPAEEQGRGQLLVGRGRSELGEGMASALGTGVRATLSLRSIRPRMKSSSRTSR